MSAPLAGKLRKLVIASSNPGKLREFEAILEPLGIEIVPQSALGIQDAEEPHRTFIENALAKARHAARASRLPALADDSGICAHALGGEPGVYSARYAAGLADGAASKVGRAEQDLRNNMKLIEALANEADRAAHYYCVLVLMRHGDDPQPLITEGSWLGKIVAQPRGENGFGYDPHFLLPDLGKTAAEIGPEQKNLVSHRGKALRRMLARLKESA